MKVKKLPMKIPRKPKLFNPPSFALRRARTLYNFNIE